MGVQPQITSPVQNLTGLLQAKNLMQQQQLRQSEMQDIQAQADQRTRDIADQNTVQQAMKDPAINAKIHTGDFSDLAGRIQPKTLGTLQQQQIEYQKGLLANSAETNKQRVDALAQINKSLMGLQTLTGPDGKPDLDRINSQWPSTVQNLANAGILKSANIDPSRIPKAITDPNQIQDFLATTGGAQAAHEQALADQKTQAETQKDIFTGLASKSEADTKNRQLAGMSPAGLLPEEQEKAQEEAVRQQETARHNKIAERLQAGELNVNQAKAALENKKFIAEYGTPDTRRSFTESVIKDPDSFSSLPPQMKPGVAADLVARGLSVPTQLPSDLKSRAASAGLTLQAVQNVKDLLADPDIAKSIGPISGRLGNIEQNVGDTFFGHDDPRAAKEQQLRTSLAYLQYQEGKGLLGGRPAATLMEGLKNVSANNKMSLPLINGSLSAIEQTMRNVHKEARQYSFGGASNAGGSSGAGGAVKRYNPDTGMIEPIK
jgi:hypothetical protein